MRTRLPLLLLVLALILGACGDDAATDNAGNDEAATEADPATRTVEGAYGPVEIPVDPQRIVTDMVSVDYLTALGYDTDKIVGVFGADWYAEQPDHYLVHTLPDDVVDPGFPSDVNIEAVAALEPDLILVPFDQIDQSPQLDALQQVAPLLAVPTSSGDTPEVRYGGEASFQDWRTTLRTFGTLLEMDDEAEAYIAETESQLAALSEEHGDLIASITAVEAKSAPDYMAINVLSEAQDSGVLGTILMSELGFTEPAELQAATADEYGTVEISEENMALLDGDILFLEVRDETTAHEDNPLWPTLSVVQNDGVAVVGNHWEFGGAVAARHVVADIDAALDEFASRGA